MKEEEAAIIVRRARKLYGKDGKYILDDLNMTVKKGTIYGLLGASGCGKTTLLSTLVGRKKLQSGIVRVLGKPPGDVKTIGYMPQDIALVGEFTVKGALQHFGWIYGMTNEEIDARFNFLSKLLDLPPSHKLIKSLSGGQQRRVSLAVVLVHDPQLLILDEPTVGLDPVLRQNIWDYLVKITEEKKTIIITTHYIEETNQANYIGLMRNGKILAEGNPQLLLETYGCSTIENVFLHLSRLQSEGKLTYECQDEKTTYELEEKHQQEILNKKQEKKSFWNTLKFTNRGHAKAALSKNFLRFKRHPGTLTFAFGFPFLEIAIFFLVIGGFPDDIKVGIVNEEMRNFSSCEEYKIHNQIGGFLLEDNATCIYQGLSCRFIDNMGEKLKNRVYFETKEEALNEVKRGTIHQMIHFPYNFSKAVTIVRSGNNDYGDDDIDMNTVYIYRDVLDQTLSTTIEKELYETHKRYSESLAKDCNTNPHLDQIPIVFNEPIYGHNELTYKEFMAPGMLIIITSFLALGVSSLTITLERTEGIWDRTLVAGLSKAEIIIFHILTFCCISLVQVAELFVLAFWVFNLDCKGNKLSAFLLVYLQSIVGICYGILISVISDNVTEANYTTMGTFYPFITLSGCLWPAEGMPKVLKILRHIVPTTLPVECMSHIIFKGWGIFHYQVFKGFVASFSFIAILTLLSVIILKYENK